jgi:hypothetical protein
MNGFDFDGVISIGIYPGPEDIIITGRSFDEALYVNTILKARGIFNAVYFNPITREKRKTGTPSSRKNSGQHKATVIRMLKENGVLLDKFFEDDEIQIEEIKKVHPKLKIVHIVSDLVVK